MEAQQLVILLPVAIWRTIILFRIDDDMADLRRNHFKAILRSIFNFKIASKKLNNILDDQFLLDTIDHKKYRRLRKTYRRLRIKGLASSCQFTALRSFIDLVYYKKIDTSNLVADQLSTVVKYLDLRILEDFVQIVKPTPQSYAVLREAMYAYKQRNQAILLYLLKTLVKGYFFFLSYSKDNVAQIVEKFEKGKQINFNIPHKLAELFAVKYYNEQEITERIDELFREDSTRGCDRVLVPEGELLNLEKIVQKKAFKRQKTNVWGIQMKKNVTYRNQGTLVYQEKNGTKHEIDITVEFDQSDSSKPVTYCYEGLSTTNIYALILNTSLNSKLFSSYLAQQTYQFVAVTKELLELPYEQQPWFLGKISDSMKGVLAENPSVFFTCSYWNKIYLCSNLAAKFTIELQGENISTHFLNKFVVGIHNSGLHATGIAEHFVQKAVHEGDLDKVKQALLDNNVDLRTVKYLSFHENLVKDYICSTWKTDINNDMLIWLIENGAYVLNEQPAYYSSCTTIEYAIERCDDRVIKLLSEKGQIIVNDKIWKSAVKKGLSFDTFKSCFINFSHNSNGYTQTLALFLECVENGTYSSVTYKVKTLIMTAWKYDQNSLFSQLPKEIVMEILSYDGIDEPPYWEYVDFLIKNWPRQPQLTKDEDVARILPLIWKNWEEPRYSICKDELIVKFIFDKDYFRLQQEKPLILVTFLKWALKLLQRMDPQPEAKHPANQLTQYCLVTSSDLTLSILKLIIKKKISHFECSRMAVPRKNLPPVINYVSAGFLAIAADNKAAIDLLLQYDLLPVRYSNGMTLDSFFATYPQTMHWVKYIQKYLDNKNKNIV